MISKQKNDMSLLRQNQISGARFSSPSWQGFEGEVSRAIIVLTLAFAILTCNRKPFVSHKLRFEKISENCENLKPSFRMVSNVAGERYEFEKCLSASFSKDQLEVTRQGDTVMVRFEKPTAQALLYKITLDIDSYPRYNFITIDDETFNVIPSN